MKRYAALSSLLAMTLFATGFNWPFAASDSCRDAKKLILELPAQTTEAKRKEIERRVTELCPTGAAGHFLKGLQFERAGSNDQAMVEYREALAIDPDFYPAQGNLGLLHMKKGGGEEAAVELSAGLKSGDPRYNAGLARFLAEKSLYQLAIYHFSQALAASPDDASLYTEQAEAYVAVGRTQKAEDAFRNALRIEPGNGRARHGLGALLLGRGETDKAMGELKQAAIAEPGNKEVHRLLAEVYSRKGDLKSAEFERVLAGVNQKQVATSKTDHLALGDAHRARKEYEAAMGEYRLRLTDEPTDAVAQQHLADCLLATGRDDEAIRFYREALRNKAENPQLHFNLATIYERKALLDEAVVEYRQVLASTPENEDARQRLADIYTLRGSFPQALEQYRELIKRKPADPVVQLKLARAYANTKDIPAAVEAYTAAIKLDNDALEAHRELANLQRRRNLMDEAAKEYQEVLRIKKDDTEARSALTAVYVKNKNYDALAALLKEGVELAPTDPNAHYKLGLVYEFKRDYDAATAQYKEAVTLKPDHAKALNAMGRVQMKSGRIAEAKESLEAAKKADPELEEATVLLSNIKDELTPEPRKHRKSKGKHGKSVKKGKKGKAEKAGASKKSAKKSKKAKKAKPAAE